MPNVKRIRDNVYVIGAGFSKGCGYPLSTELLVKVWPRISYRHRIVLKKIIEFHHPRFNQNNSLSFPNIEKLLTELSVNIDMFDSSRRLEGGFLKNDLIEIRMNLLGAISLWFHEIYRDARSTHWLDKFVQKMQKEEAGIISFNWDLLLDQKLFGGNISGEIYGLSKELPKSGPIILKPHGSLNWYTTDEVKNVNKDNRKILFHDKKQSDQIELFMSPRAIKSKTNQEYTPLIVAPSYFKDFNKPVFQHIWNHSTELLSTARRIIFLGYSLPPDDLQARYILRCGFYNQVDGIIRRNGRLFPTGNSEIIVVNPDVNAVERIKEIVNTGVKVSHTFMKVEQWIEAVNEGND